MCKYYNIIPHYHSCNAIAIWDLYLFIFIFLAVQEERGPRKNKGNKLLHTSLRNCHPSANHISHADLLTAPMANVYNRDAKIPIIYFKSDLYHPYVYRPPTIKWSSFESIGQSAFTKVIPSQKSLAKHEAGGLICTNTMSRKTLFVISLSRYHTS